MNKQPKEKVHLKDIQETILDRGTPVFIVGEKKFWADRITKDQLATHADCVDCGKEFEKQYTSSKRCSTCQFKYENKQYEAIEIVEWDGKAGLCLYGDDKYFFSQDDIDDYCVDNETAPSALQLVLCEETKFPHMEIYDLVNDCVHEDWEPDAHLEKLVNDLNAYLKTASTNTWIPTKKRVQLEDPE